MPATPAPVVSPECALAPDLHSCRQSRWGNESSFSRLFKGAIGLVCPSWRCSIRERRHETCKTVCGDDARTAAAAAGNIGAGTRRRTLRQFTAQTLVREPAQRVRAVLF